MNKQYGVALLAVMIVMLLIAVIGTIAVRSATLGLQLASQRQIQTLLRVSSDAVLFALEHSRQINQAVTLTNVLRYFDDENHAQDELVFCYWAQSRQFLDLQQPSVIHLENNAPEHNGSRGFCRANHYATGRDAVISQVYFKKGSIRTQPFAAAPLGSELGQQSMISASIPIEITVVSVLPSLSGQSDTAIESCFQRSTTQVMACFKQLNVPLNVQRADYQVRNWLRRAI